MAGADPEGACVYADESWFVGKAYGGRCWGEQGKPTWIPAFGPTQGQALYLGLDVASGELLWRYSPSTTAVESTDYLGYLVQRYADRKYLAVVWDNASWHKAAHLRPGGWRITTPPPWRTSAQRYSFSSYPPTVHG